MCHLSGCRAGHCHSSISWGPRYPLQSQDKDKIQDARMMLLLAQRGSKNDQKIALRKGFHNFLKAIWEYLTLASVQHPRVIAGTHHVLCDLTSPVSGDKTSLFHYQYSGHVTSIDQSEASIQVT